MHAPGLGVHFAFHFAFTCSSILALSVRRQRIFVRGMFYSCIVAFTVNVKLTLVEISRTTFALHLDLKQRPFKCEQCDSTFGQRSSLTRHFKTLHERRA
jgi:hypothetical protein